MNVWNKIEIYDKRLSFNLPSEFEKIPRADVGNEITKINPEYCFKSDEGEYVLVKQGKSKFEKIGYEMRRFDDYLCATEPEYRRISVKERKHNGYMQMVMCYTSCTNAPADTRFYMLALQEHEENRYLFMLVCQYDDKEKREPIFYSILDSLNVSLSEEVMNGQRQEY